MTMNLEEFVKTQKFFNALRAKAVQERSAVSVPSQNADFHFGIAAYAAALLYSRGRERLQELEREQVVHLSTIAGGSLNSAMGSLTDYIVHQEEVFTRDEYEQLARTCYSARRLLERERE